MLNNIISIVQHGVLWLFYFLRYSLRQFYRQRGLQIASSLAYATLLSLVPMITVVFAFMGTLPVFKDLSLSVQIFVYENFIPSFGDMVWQYLNTFSKNASQLTITGISILLIIALMLMATIDNALNTIWHVRNRRNPIARFLVYWAIITLGPMLVGISLLSTSYLMSLPMLTEVDISYGLNLKKRLLSWLPFITTSIAFTLIYILIPNCFVYRRHALIGGVIAAITFELAKYGFGIYVSSMTSYQTIYGAIAVIPMFLIWIYTSWVVVIFGAHMSFCLSAFRFKNEQAGIHDPEWTFIDAYQLLRVLWQVQRKGIALSMARLHKHGIRFPQYQVSEIMELLHRARWVQKNSSGDWLLSRDLDELTVMDLSQIIPKRLPIGQAVNTDIPGSRKLTGLLDQYNDNIQAVLAVSIGALFREPDD